MPISGPWVPPTAVTYGLVAGNDGKYCEEIFYEKKRKETESVRRIRQDCIEQRIEFGEE